MQMVESRQSERVRSFLRARIVFNNRNSTIDCIVKNISPTGAKIEVGNSLSVPSEFDLEIPQRGRTYRCKIMWRDQESMGVAFAVLDGQVSADLPETRLERLERENGRLKLTVVKLTKRLEDLGQVVDGAF